MKVMNGRLFVGITKFNSEHHIPYHIPDICRYVFINLIKL